MRSAEARCRASPWTAITSIRSRARRARSGSTRPRHRSSRTRPVRWRSRPTARQLIVTTKANTNAIDVFSIDAFGELSASPTVNADPGAVPFAVSFDGGGNLVVAEAGTNALATFALHANGTATLLHRVVPVRLRRAGSPARATYFYASNAGSGSESGFASGAGGALSLLGQTATDGGTVDAASTPDGGFLYVQTGAAGNVDGYRVNGDGSLTPAGSVVVPGAVGGEGIVAL